MSQLGLGSQFVRWAWVDVVDGVTPWCVSCRVGRRDKANEPLLWDSPPGGSNHLGDHIVINAIAGFGNAGGRSGESADDFIQIRDRRL